MFTIPAVADPLTQGDLFDDCPLLSLGPDKAPIDLHAMGVKRWHSRVIVLTQPSL